MLLGQRIAGMATLCRSCSLGDLLGAQVGYAELAQKLLLAGHSGRVFPMCGRDFLAVRLFQCF